VSARCRLRRGREEGSAAAPIPHLHRPQHLHELVCYGSDRPHYLYECGRRRLGGEPGPEEAVDEGGAAAVHDGYLHGKGIRSGISRTAHFYRTSATIGAASVESAGRL
jgi:hypothetical protein